MFPLGEISAWHVLKITLINLSEITLWLVVSGGIGLIAGIALLMIALRWMFPWSKLHQLRQHKRGWIWLILQWIWVTLWGICLPLLCLILGAMIGGAYGTRNLVLYHNVGQVMGEYILSPVAEQVVKQLEHTYPAWGNLSSQQLDAKKLQFLMENVTPILLDTALKKVVIFNDDDAGIGATEQWGRRYARQKVKQAATSFFKQKQRFVSDIIVELKKRNQEKATLKQVICCASHLYFTPAFAGWTFWWILTHALILLPLLLLTGIVPWLLFQFCWWWQQRESARSTEVILNGQ